MASDETIFLKNNGDDAIDLDNDVEVTIENNVIRNSGDDGIEIRMQSYAGPVLNIIILENLISGSDEDVIQIIDYADLSDRYILIEHNVIESSTMVGLGLMDNGDTKEDLRAANVPEPIDVINNTFINNSYGLTGGDNLIALNNIFVNSENLAMKNVDGNSIAAFNLFWNNGIDGEGSNLDINSSVFDDPRLDVEFRLLPSSPALDAGTAFFEWQGEIILDLADGEYQGNAPDLGAFEGISENMSSAPVANDDSYTTDEETALNIAAPGVLGNDTDADGDPLTAVLDTGPTNGALTPNPDGGFGYTPDPGFSGPDSFTYQASDGTAGSNVATVTITVNAANIAPVATIIAPAHGASFVEGETIIFTGAADDTEDGDLTTGLNWASDLDGAIGSGGTFSTSTLSAGLHTITAAVTDSGDLSGEDQITVTVFNAFVTSPSGSSGYSTWGGPGSNKHLLVTIIIENGVGIPLQGASVSATIPGPASYSDTLTTDSLGQVELRFNNAPSGTYETTVTNISGSQLLWNGSTPENSFIK